MTDNDSCALEKQKCVPCEGANVKPLTDDEKDHLISHVHGWSLTPDRKAIVARLKLKNFKDALALVNKIGVIAEEQGHHPDILFGWGYVEVILTTHKLDDLHRNDFVVANRINVILG